MPYTALKSCWKETGSIVSDSVASLYPSDYVWMAGGYVCADRIARQVEKNSAASVLVAPLYLIVPFVALWMKKCRVDMYSILYNNMHATHAQNRNIAQQLGEVTANRDNLQEQNSLLRHNHRFVEQDNNRLQRTAFEAELARCILQQRLRIDAAERNNVQHQLQETVVERDNLQRQLDAFFVKQQSKVIKSALDIAASYKPLELNIQNGSDVLNNKLDNHSPFYFSRNVPQQMMKRNFGLSQNGLENHQQNNVNLLLSGSFHAP